MTGSSRTLTTIADLAEAGLLPHGATQALGEVAARYAIGVTPTMADVMRNGSHGVAAQFLPDPRELETNPAERADPIGDLAHEPVHRGEPVRGIVHRHEDRVLLKIVRVCPVYCRFCFRREMIGPGQAAMLAAADLDNALAYIAANPAIWEVILTGGDPLVLAPRRIAGLVQRLGAIPHVRVLRWHTRVPVVAPERIAPELISALRAAPEKAVYVAIHANHPDEFTAAARKAIAGLADAGITLVSQTVLLRGINDDPETLARLMRTFVELRVKPYYLHHGDLAPGTTHFRTTIARGLELTHALRARLSGLAQPTYVLDLPGGIAKIPLSGSNVRCVGDGLYEIEDPQGRCHLYREAPASTED